MRKSILCSLFVAFMAVLLIGLPAHAGDATATGGNIAPAVAIDLSAASCTVTGATTLKLNSVQGLGDSYWVDLNWNTNTNKFDVIGYGLDNNPACGGWEYNGACWYTAPALGMSCNDVCAPHGGFDVAGSQHTGNAVGMHFWPGKASGTNWVSVECSSTDNNTNWGADGSAPDGNYWHQFCYTNCACNN